MNLFKTWQGIREIINITKKGIKDIYCIQVLNKTITNPNNIVNELDNHCSSIAKIIENKLAKRNFDNSNYLRNPSQQSFFISPANAEEVLFEIKNLKSDKSTRPSCIPTKFLKLLQTSLSKPISLIIYIYFSTGNFPSTLITANVIPVFKKDDHTLWNTIFLFHSCLISAKLLKNLSTYA